MLSASAQRKTVNNAFKMTFLFVSMDGTIVTIKLRGTLYAFVCKCATEKHDSERTLSLAQLDRVYCRECWAKRRPPRSHARGKQI
jgi:predicted SprT family Zn-dependent metalloprotease